MERKTQRQWVIKLTYQYDFSKTNQQDINTMLDNHELLEYEYIRGSLESIVNNLDKIDDIISSKVSASFLSRISKVDKAILRVAINEFVIQKSIPVNVSISEAVENAKIFSSEESYKFINGILSNIAKELQ